MTLQNKLYTHPNIINQFRPLFKQIFDGLAFFCNRVCICVILPSFWSSLINRCEEKQRHEESKVDMQS